MTKNNSRLSCRPYRDLYIFYLKGCVGKDVFEKEKRFIGNWEEDGFSFLFFCEPAEDLVDSLLRNRSDLTLLDQYQMGYDQWQGQRVVPMAIGRFFITPPWDDAARDSLPQGLDHRILLDPGVVFGNGTHPTTRNCLEALDTLFGEDAVHTATDLGTGTGVLALAAVQLGCRRCLALDFNFLAARTAGVNVRLNGLENNILVAHGMAQDFIDIQADLVMANIHFDVMKDLVISKGFLEKKWCILSGLLRSEARDVADRLSSSGVDIIKSWEQDDVWHTFLGKIH